MRENEPEFGDALACLSEILADNYVNMSLPDISSEDKERYILKKPFSRPYNKNNRVIAVIGAGAGVAAGLASSTEAIESIRKHIETEKRLVDSEVIRAEIQQLRLVGGLNPQDFETQLQAFSKYHKLSTIVRDKLRSIYRKKYLPVEFYEILAHLLKHRYLDAIINFNFDELLDQAVKDELADPEYLRIISDGDFSANTKKQHGKYGLPIYIKPHGTVSHPSTLRFTREDYFHMPYGIREALEDMICGQHVTLIVIGFSMKSFEFNEIVRKALYPSEIYYLDICEPKPDPPLGDNVATFWLEVGTDLSDSHYTISGILNEVLTKVRNLFQEYYEPRGIVRHRLISDLFEKVDLERDSLEDYFHDRTLVELAIAVAKSKGVIDINSIIKERCGNYYKLYRSHAESGSLPLTLADFCGYFELSNDISYSGEIFCVCINGESILGRNILLESTKHEDILKDIAERTYSRLRNKRLFPDSKDMISNLERSFIKLCDAENTEIRLWTDNIFLSVSAEAKRLGTELSLRYNTVRLLEEENWNTMLIVAETGKWLINPYIVNLINCQEKRRLVVIVSTEQLADTIQNHYQNHFKTVVIRELNWWEHNRHLTLLLQDKRPVAAVYFYRHLRSANINPVILKNQEDLETAIFYFRAYWKKAETNNLITKKNLPELDAILEL